MLIPSYEEVERLSAEYNTIPVFWEIPADHWSPLQMFAALSRGEETAFLLESINTPDSWQSWSYIGCHPSLTIRAENGRNTITAFDSTSPAGENSIEALVRAILEAKKSPQFPDMPAFTGGFAGFLEHPDNANCELHLYDEVVAYHHLRSTAVIIVNLHCGADLAAQYQAAEIRAAEIASKIEGFRLAPQYRDDEPPLTVAWQRTAAQVVHAPDSFELYRRMRSRFPAPCLCYFRYAQTQFAGVSRNLTADIPASGSSAGFWGYNGIRETCRTEQAVSYRNTWDARACVMCDDRQDTATVLELMKSAKSENTAV